MDCVFCRIASGQIPSNKFYEDENSIAFLDIRPVKPGHTLVIPKKHSPYLFEAEDAEYAKLMLAVKKVAEVLKKAFLPKSGKVGSIIYGLDVDHAHIHLIPIDQAGDLSLAKARPASDQELALTLEKIKDSQ